MNNSREFINAQGEKVRLEANGLTPVRFYMITKKDLIDTINETLISELQYIGSISKIASMKLNEFEKLSEAERDKMYEVFKSSKLGNTQFYFDFTAALIMSADKNLRDYESVLQMIPPTWFKSGSKEAQGIGELMLSYRKDLEEIQKKNK